MFEMLVKDLKIYRWIGQFFASNFSAQFGRLTRRISSVRDGENVANRNMSMAP